MAGRDARRARRPARASRPGDCPLSGGLVEVAGAVVRELDDPRPLARLVPLTPLPETAADVLRVDLEGVADVLEREQPASIFRRDPFLGLEEHLVAARIADVRVLLVAVDG